MIIAENIKILFFKINKALFCLTKFSILFVMFNIFSISQVRAEIIEPNVITTDSRIKTYVYAENEVYLLNLHYGFQTHIEFSKGEFIETLSLGDSYAWKITPVANRLFIKPMEKNVYTNMTIITNKRIYQFDLVSKEFEEDSEKDLVYTVKFYYPLNKKSYE